MNYTHRAELYNFAPAHNSGSPEILMKYQDFSFYYNIISSSRALKILILDYHRISLSDLVSLYDFTLMEEMPRNEQTFKLMENKNKTFLANSDGEIKEMVDSSVPRNTKKSTKYAGTIFVRTP